MKKIFLLLMLSMATAITCKAQLNHTTDFVKILLPAGASKLNKQQVDAVHTFKISGQSYSPPYVYKIDNKVLGLFNVNQDPINDLPREKVFQDELALHLIKNGNHSYKSNIKNIGNSKVLIVNYAIHDKGHYRFYYQNAAKTLTQAGKIDYNNADSVKAKSLLDAILNNIEFTK